MEDNGLAQVCGWSLVKILCLDLGSELSQLKCLEFHSNHVLFSGFSVLDASFQLGEGIVKRNPHLFLNIVLLGWGNHIVKVLQYLI